MSNGYGRAIIVPLLKGINLDIYREFVSSWEPRDGKSTLLFIIGALKPTEGRVLVNSIDMMSLKDTVTGIEKTSDFPVHNLVPNLTVEENIIPVMGGGRRKIMRRD